MSLNFLLRDESLFRRSQTNPAPIFRRSTRRLLLGVLACCVAAMAGTALFAPSDWVALLLAGFAVLQMIFRWLAGRCTRGLAFAPTRLLDERQLQDVHSAYRRAYGITIVVLLVLMAVVYAGPPIEPVRAGVTALFFLLHLMIWLPTAVLAWRLHDEEPWEPEIP